jgi:hypothetical protein
LRSAYSSGMSGSASTLCVLPFTLSVNWAMWATSLDDGFDLERD